MYLGVGLSMRMRTAAAIRMPSRSVPSAKNSKKYGMRCVQSAIFDLGGAVVMNACIVDSPEFLIVPPMHILIPWRVY